MPLIDKNKIKVTNQRETKTDEPKKGNQNKWKEKNELMKST